MKMSLSKAWVLTAFASAVLLLHVGGITAHHSGEMFEPDRTVTFEGVVKEFQYVNPHSWLIVDVTKEDGSTETWGFEAEGPSVLIRGGVFKNDLPPGTKITITARPMRDGRPAAIWSKVITDDGTVLDWRTPGRDEAE